MHWCLDWMSNRLEMALGVDFHNLESDIVKEIGLHMSMKQKARA